MNKRQYTFLFLLIILLYLSYTVIEYEYKRYINEGYKEQQRQAILEIKTKNKEGKEIIEHRKTLAYINKGLKKDHNKKMKGEEVINITLEETYNKFKKTSPSIVNKAEKEKTQQESITQSMTNFQKWIYFLLKKDLR